MPSHSTRERLAPEEPMPRREIPCVVGCATRLDERRNRLKPGTVRRRSSRLSPGVPRICLLSSTDTEAGVSAATLPSTVMLVRTGSIFSAGSLSGGGVWARTAGGKSRIARAKQAMRSPASGLEGAGIGAEDDLKALLIDRRLWRISVQRVNQRQVLKDSINVAFFRNANLEILSLEANLGALLLQAPGEEG